MALGSRVVMVAITLILAIATMLFVLRALSVSVPGPGLDESWSAVMGQASTWPARWGIDLIFTYGPASALETRFYTDGYLVYAVPFLCAVALVQGAAMVWLARNAGAGRHPATFLMLAAAAFVGLAGELAKDQDGFFFAFGFTLYLIDLVRRPADRASLVILAAGAAAMGVMALCKTSYGVVALGLCVIADCRAALARVRLPLPTPVFLVAFVVTFLAYGQRLGDLPTYLALQWQVAAGYGEAMYLTPNRVEVATFLLAAAALLAMVAVCVPIRKGFVNWVSAILATAFVLTVGFKAGFIRADAHTQIAWSLIGLAGLAVGTGLALQRSKGLALALSMASLLILWIVAPLFLLVDTDRAVTLNNLPSTYQDFVESVRGEVGAWGRFLRSPSGFAADAAAAKEAAWAGIRAAHPLPALNGGVDILPSEQSSVLAAALDYRPRPSFQDYSTYTAALIAANAAFYTSPKAPAWVLFDVGALDDRYPTTSEGALWPEFLQRYEPTRLVGDWLALHRRAVPLPNVLGATVRVGATLGSTVKVPMKGPVFVRITTTKTLLGHLAAAVFRPPALSMRVNLAGGVEQTYRFIPALGAAGFLLSPILNDPQGFADLGFGTGDVVNGAEVESLVIGGSHWTTVFYGATMDVEFQPVTVAPAPPSPEARPLYESLSAGLPWRLLVHALGRDKDLAGDHLSVPAPTALVIPVARPQRIRVDFGIEDGAWTEGKTQGVCFALKVSQDAPTPLWQRCLNPAEVRGDRGTQSAELNLPAGTNAVTAETTCPNSCDWGWSYWSGIKLGSVDKPEPGPQTAE